MKKFILITVVVVVAGALVWLIWLKPPRPEEEEAKPATEIPVHVGKIVRATLRGYVTGYGTVEPAPPGERPAAGARLAASVPGLLTAVKCAEGQRVEKGAVLFELDSRAADAAAEKARRAVEFTEKTLERQKKLMQAEGTSQKLLLEAEAACTAARNDLAGAQTQQALLRVQSPLTGTVTHVNVKPGEAVDLVTVLAEVIDLDRLVVNANVPNTELAALKAGQPAEIRPEHDTNVVTCAITYVGQQVDPKTGTALVRAALPAGSGLRPGQFVALRIVSEEHKDRLAVPAESVVKDEQDRTVIALVQNNQATLKPVTAGLRDGELIEVQAQGLEEGMTIVTAGAYGLPKETRIRVLGGGTEATNKEAGKTKADK